MNEEGMLVCIKKHELNTAGELAANIRVQKGVWVDI